MTSTTPPNPTYDPPNPTYDPETHFLQPRLPGYRQITNWEAELMGSAKELEMAVAQEIKDTEAHLARHEVINASVARQLALSRTKFEEGFYHLIRAIARPNDPYR